MRQKSAQLLVSCIERTMDTAGALEKLQAENSAMEAEITKLTASASGTRSLDATKVGCSAGMAPPSNQDPRVGPDPWTLT